MAGIKAPITDILTRLTTKLKDTDVVKFVQIWNDQFRFMEDQQTYSFPFPCVFVEVVNDLEFNQIGGGYEQADIDWCIHIGQDFYNADDGTQEQNLTIFDLRDKVVEVLSNYKPTACGLMFRTKESQDYEHTNVYHYKVYFRCGFIDSKGAPDDVDVFDQNFVIKDPPITLEIDGSLVEEI
jgi:hypothetical protein